VMTTNTSLIAIEATGMILAWRRSREAPDDGEAAARFATKRHEVSGLASIAAGFLAGTIVGALAFQAAGFWSLLLPTAAMLLLTASASTERDARTNPAA
jgi:uncharacterized membrane protein YoaK (UPF0700 family)